MVASGDSMQLDHTACIAHEIHLILSTVLKKKKRPSEQDREALEMAVEAEPDAVCTEYEGDDELSDADREQMQTLRDDILEEMDTFVNNAVEDVKKDHLAEMRVIVQKFRSLAVYFRKSPKARNRLALLQTEKLRIPKKDVSVKIMSEETCTLMTQWLRSKSAAMRLCAYLMRVSRGWSEQN
ncbi:hypothetical protein F441_07554 [Phytophthora nicotianae CJ01A1]|uniref:Uncharacterized protein n=1 Tax=Phytophthora nicotianae CJ01A1 TaxID=1317063 RepID=W2X744_PHYNI|nr:hypothetical protein F441_07554 [Phytophthora nicotianae CJ01A1]